MSVIERHSVSDCNWEAIIERDVELKLKRLTNGL